MPTAFHLFKLKRLPRGPRFGTEDQLYLEVDHQESREAVHTTVTMTTSDYRATVDRLEAVHDFRKRLRYPGRARSHVFQEYVSEYRFPVFVDRQSPNEERVLMVRTKAEVAKDFMERLRKVPEFIAVERRVDFGAMRPQLSFIRGAWFANMRSANLASAGMFGEHVDRSDEFMRAERLGTLSSLTVFYPCGGREYHTMITSSGTIVLYESFETEEDELDVALAIKRGLLDRAWAM